MRFHGKHILVTCLTLMDLYEIINDLHASKCELKFGVMCICWTRFDIYHFIFVACLKFLFHHVKQINIFVNHTHTFVCWMLNWCNWKLDAFIKPFTISFATVKKKEKKTKNKQTQIEEGKEKNDQQLTAAILGLFVVCIGIGHYINKWLHQKDTLTKCNGSQWRTF